MSVVVYNKTEKGCAKMQYLLVFILFLGLIPPVFSIGEQIWNLFLNIF